MGASLLALAKSVYYIYFVRKAWPRIARGLMILNYSMSIYNNCCFFIRLFHLIFLGQSRKPSLSVKSFGGVLEIPFKRGDSLIESEEVQINAIPLNLSFLNELQCIYDTSS